jgi:chloramphenicol 3-O phosphotransferase
MEVYRRVTSGEMRPKGTIILLNGVSSAGKSTLARAFVNLMPDYFHMSVDDFADWVNSMEDQDKKRIIPVETDYFFHRTIAMFADSGVNVIVDHLLHDECTTKDCCAALKEYPVMFVGVHCPTDELIRREEARGDRHEGQAVRQLGFVHSGNTYDLELDTLREDAEKCAQRIKAALDKGKYPSGWLATCRTWI